MDYMLEPEEEQGPVATDLLGNDVYVGDDVFFGDDGIFRCDDLGYSAAEVLTALGWEKGEYRNV